jgi:copper chaperone CopZ
MLGEKKLLIPCLLIIALIFFCTPTWAEDSRRTFFKVGNLSCGVCLGKIDAKLKIFDGYISMLANFDKGLVAVDHQQNLTDSEISEAITSIGYPAKVASESEYDQHSSISSESPGWRSPSDGFLSRILEIFGR